jgi:hypothetical protein
MLVRPNDLVKKLGAVRGDVKIAGPAQPAGIPGLAVVDGGVDGGIVDIHGLVGSIDAGLFVVCDSRTELRVADTLSERMRLEFPSRIDRTDRNQRSIRRLI